MREIKTYIIEKLKISINRKNVEHTLFPKTKDELKQMITSEIKENGNGCSLNHIDVSKIDDMSYMFANSKFDGDISNWDVSNAKDMSYMFADSNFNRDISKWDVSNVKYMARIFNDCPLEKNPPKWYKV